MQLSVEDQKTLDEVLRGGVQRVRTVQRALILRQVSQGERRVKVAGQVRVGVNMVYEVCKRYQERGLQGALYDKPRPGAAPLLKARERQEIVAMVCSPAPEGQARWSVRLIAEEAVKRGLVARVGRETIRVLLQNHDLQPWREKNVVRAKVGSGICKADGRRAGGI